MNRKKIKASILRLFGNMLPNILAFFDASVAAGEKDEAAEVGDEKYRDRLCFDRAAGMLSGVVFLREPRSTLRMVYPPLFFCDGEALGDYFRVVGCYKDGQENRK